MNILNRFSKKKSSNIKFHENPSSKSLVVPCRQTNGQTNEQTDRHEERHDEAKSNFHNFAKVPINQTFVQQSKLIKYISVHK